MTQITQIRSIPMAVMAVALLVTPLKHPTPVVELVRQPDVIRQSLAGSQKFFVRTVTIGRDDLARIRQVVDYSPEDRDVRFYSGQDQGGRVSGVVVFPQVNTMHGPVEVGVAFGPSGEIINAVVTKATAETRPWVQRAVASGLTARFKGMKSEAEVNRALEGLSSDNLGNMPYYFATVIAQTVKRGMTLYHTLWK